MRIYKIGRVNPVYVLEETESQTLDSVLPYFQVEKREIDSNSVTRFNGYQPGNIYILLCNWIGNQQEHYFIDALEAEGLVRAFGTAILERDI